MSDISPELAAQFDTLIAKLNDRFPDLDLFPEKREEMRRVGRIIKRTLPVMRCLPPPDGVETYTVNRGAFVGPPITVIVRKP